MVAFEVLVNGKRRYVAGHTDAHFLQIEMTGTFPATASGVFAVHGFFALPATKEDQLESSSYPSERVSVGDQVTIRVIEVDRADPPTKWNDAGGSMEIVAEAK